MTENPKDILRSVMPVLTANFQDFHQRYMVGDCPAGAFRYVRDRLNQVSIILDHDLLVEPARIAILTLDLEGGLQTPQFKDQAKEIMGKWMKMMISAGLTEKHSIFGFPVAPSEPAPIPS